MIDGYADDLSLFLRVGTPPQEDTTQFNKIIEILNQFKELSWLAVNFKKAQIVPFGKKDFTSGEL